MTDGMRQEFEKWALETGHAGEGYSLRLAKTYDGYYSGGTQWMWEAWQAGTAQAYERIAGMVQKSAQDNSLLPLAMAIRAAKPVEKL